MNLPTLTFLFLHTLEDAALISVGAYVPLPAVVKYGLGMAGAWFLFAWLLSRLGHKH